MTRTMWVSNGRLYKTGYGNQTDLFLPRLKQAGYDPILFAFTDSNGAPMWDKDGILNLQRKYDPWGSDMIAAHMDWSKADFSFGLFDMYAATPAAYAQHPHAHWVPVDAEPLRPDLKSGLAAAARWVVAMSRFGERVLRDAGFDPLYVPHGVDGKVYHPIDRAKARARLQKTVDQDYPTLEHRYQLKGKFLILMNAANIGTPGRKGFYEALMAFKAFHADHPDSLLYLHTSMKCPRGENLFVHIDALGIDRSAILFPNQYFYDMGMLDGEFMNDLYNAADVLLHPSHGEGFGIPIVEAQMSGCPVIVTDASAMSELCLTGTKVPGTPYAYGGGLYWVRPNLDALIGALEQMLTATAVVGGLPSRQEISDRVQAYEIDRVFTEHMLPALEKIRDGAAADRAASAEKDHKHRWAPIQVAINGMFHAPCLVPGCEAARRQDGMVRGAFFPSRIGDISLNIEDDPQGGVSKFLMWECQHQYHLDQLDLKPDEVVADIGAHVGVPAIYLAKRYGVQVHAFEPLITNYERLVRNIRANGVEHLVHAHHAAVTTDGRPIQIARDQLNSGGASIYSGAAGDSVESFSLMYVLNYSNLAMLKIDCEGAEYELLEGNTHLLSGLRYVVGEFHTNNVFSQERFEALRDGVTAAVKVANISWGRMTDTLAPVTLEDQKRQEPVIIAPRRFIPMPNIRPHGGIDANQPDVSVLMPVYNGLSNYPPGQLEKAISSSLAQEGVNVEICIVDDASSPDDHLFFLPQLDLPNRKGVRIRRSDINQGVAMTLNAAASMATGRHIIVQSVRSWYEPGSFAAMVKALDQNPEIGFVYGQTQYHGARTDLHTPPTFDRRRFIEGSFDSLFGYMYRREALVQGCRYAEYIEREGRKIDISDYDFAMQLIVDLNWTGLALPDLLALHYVYSGEGQMTNLVHKYQAEIDAIFDQRWGAHA